MHANTTETRQHLRGATAALWSTDAATRATYCGHASAPRTVWAGTTLAARRPCPANRRCGGLAAMLIGTLFAGLGALIGGRGHV